MGNLPDPAAVTLVRVSTVDLQVQVSVLIILTGEEQLEAPDLKKKSLAMRRGVHKTLDLNLPLHESASDTTEPGMELQERPLTTVLFTPLDQMIPNPVSPPPAPKPRQVSPATIKARHLSTAVNDARMLYAGRCLFTSPTLDKPVKAAVHSGDTPILNLGTFLAIPSEPNRPLLSPIHLIPHKTYMYSPVSSPFDSDFDLYGPMSTPTASSPTKCVHTR